MLKLLSALFCLALLSACGDDNDTDLSSRYGPSDRSAPTTSGTNTPPGQTPSTDPAPDTGESVPVANTAPTITGTPPNVVAEGARYDFRPYGADSDGDIISYFVTNNPPWTTFDPQTGRLSGTPAASDVGAWPGIGIGVSDGSATASLPLFNINVESAPRSSVLIGWNPPTANTDESPLTDLAGFNIYWGTEPENLTESVTLTEPGASNYVVEDLAAGTYYFSVSAFNNSMVESELSQAVVTIVN
jgi:hypothetical protein